MACNRRLTYNWIKGISSKMPDFLFPSLIRETGQTVPDPEYPDQRIGVGQC